MKRFICLLLVCIVTLLGGANAQSLWKDASERYEAARSYMSSGDYWRAADAFDALNGYAEARRYAAYCRAIRAAQSGMYASAVLNLKALDDFLDSAMLAVYYSALAFEADGNYEAALELLINQSFYLDAEARIAQYPRLINKRDYEKALELEASGSLEDAFDAFLALGDYSDSASRAQSLKERIDQRDYASAEALEAAGVYAGAYDLFVRLSDYIDSPSRASAIKTQALYDKGVAAIDEGRYILAYDCFSLIDYRDSDIKAHMLDVCNFAGDIKTKMPGVFIYEFHEVYGLANMNENSLKAPQWREVGEFHEDLAWATMDGDKYGVIDTRGEVISDYTWDKISDYNDGRCVV
ncbi:MAG: WG repeat-containing protein, partial [Clostridia bacterium]|nr:WG repeat-containing protein [Clostridia bacterium]